MQTSMAQMFPSRATSPSPGKNLRSIPSIRSGRLRNLIMGAALLACWAGSARPQTQVEDRDPMGFHDQGGLTVNGHLQFGLNAVVERNLYWDLASVTAPGSGFDPDTNWLEGYFKPGISFEKELDTGAVFYGKLSAVASYTWGIDAFDTGNTGATTVEEAYLAIRGDSGAGLSYDLSLGARELVLGTGMLIANGGTSGFERGALKLGPRKAWEMAAIGRLTFGGLTGTAFYLNPNELPSTDGDNELAGIDLRLDNLQGGYVGATFVNVLNSTSPYPQAAPGGVGPPTVIPGAREGTSTFNLICKDKPVFRHPGELELHGRVCLPMERQDRPSGLGRSGDGELCLSELALDPEPDFGLPDLLGGRPEHDQTGALRSALLPG